MTMMGIVMVRLPVDVLFLNGEITIDQLLLPCVSQLHRELYTKNEDGGGDSLEKKKNNSAYAYMDTFAFVKRVWK